MASASSASEDAEQNYRASDQNPEPGSDRHVSQTNVDRWKKGGHRGLGDGRKPDEGSAASDRSQQQQPAHDTLREERLRMVIHQLYGTQSHYQAAQKFLKNRTLRKMNNNGGMTLYERIMAYRKLKEGEEAEDGTAVPASPDKPAGDEVEQGPQNRPASSKSNKNKALDDSPNKRPTSSRNTPRQMDRSDTSFASVDISDLTELDEEKNRSPTPQPTFEDRPLRAKSEQQLGHNYEAQVTARDVDVQLDDSEEKVITDRRASSAVERTVVATAAIATVARAHTSAAVNSQDNRRIKNEQNQNESQKSTTQKDKYENTEVHIEKSENKQVYKSENKEDHTEKSENIETKEVSKSKEIHEKSESKEVSKEMSEDTEVRKEKYEDTRMEKVEDTEEVKEKDKQEDTRKEKREETFERSVEEVATVAVVTKAVNDSSQQEKSKRKENKKEERRREKSERKENKVEEEDHTSKEEDRHSVTEIAVEGAVITKAVCESSTQKEISKEKNEEKISKKEEESKKKQEEKINKKESSKVSKSRKSEAEKSKSERSSSSRSSRHEETSFIEEASDTVKASVAASSSLEKPKSPAKTPETPARTPEAFTIETVASPVAGAAPAVAAAAAAAASPKPKKSKSRPKSSKKKDRNKERENESTIAALDKLADKNLNNLLGNDDGGEEPEIDKEMLDKVFSPTFQAELDNFLRTT